MILKCNCKHDFQDSKHGNGKRVHNKMGLDGKEARCTVCGSTKAVPGKEDK